MNLKRIFHLQDQAVVMKTPSKVRLIFRDLPIYPGLTK